MIDLVALQTYEPAIYVVATALEPNWAAVSGVARAFLPKW